MAYVKVRLCSLFKLCVSFTVSSIEHIAGCSRIHASVRLLARGLPILNKHENAIEPKTRTKNEYPSLSVPVYCMPVVESWSCIAPVLEARRYHLSYQSAVYLMLINDTPQSVTTF